MAFTEDVISKLSRKNSTGFDASYPIGTEAKYVSGIRGTNVNNIEEQFLIGVDCIATSYTDDQGNEYITQEFRTESATENYYILETVNFSITSTATRYLKNNTLYVPSAGDASINQTNNSVDFNNDGTSTYSTNQNTLQINVPNDDNSIVSYSLLQYQGAAGTEVVEIAEKTVYEVTEEDGKIIQKQVIKNLLP